MKISVQIIFTDPFKVELPVTSPTLQFEMEVVYLKNMQEPCLVNGACEATSDDIGNTVEDIKKSMKEQPFDYLNVTTYHFQLQYECPLAQEFLTDPDTYETEATINKTCTWDESWTPDDQIPLCVCKYFFTDTLFKIAHFKLHKYVL